MIIICGFIWAVLGFLFNLFNQRITYKTNSN
ncbi:DUF2953 domain-containing protein [Dickeya zeae]|uniref:DUF2953 domain-containing protein n=1 Tax=Dickeya zeae TaxID=204042 RepID=A0ABX8VWB2_9GAMM|nr:DUF2953 domain-containing protein [Dickeya zeae]UJR53320.1 DUF2953 domain-containing protein [Dickeya zeae MS1]UJR57437.1 DUF2953 domain-containing protein [Dickeya zeae]UJR62956.1 DUF2953 domain-containing protein [Dickeya zeae]